MANQLHQILSQWHGHKQQKWVLATVYHTIGSSYRKAGAMMMFSEDGQQLGLVSGGCLEADIQLQARKAMDSGLAFTLTYDGNDEDDISFQLGIGCGGVVQLMLQPLTPQNNYLELEQVYQHLEQRLSGYYWQKVPQQKQVAQACFEPVDNEISGFNRRTEQVQKDDGLWLKTQVLPEPHLLVVGGGIDARPLVTMAHHLGWRVSLWDPRPANARREYFPNADKILSCDSEQLSRYVAEQKVDAAMLMAHSTNLDAEALKVLAETKLKYLGLLGPEHRREQVLAMAELKPEQVIPTLAGPVGLQLGGDLPESIALGILAECHARLYDKSAKSLSLDL